MFSRCLTDFRRLAIKILTLDAFVSSAFSLSNNIVENSFQIFKLTDDILKQSATPPTSVMFVCNVRAWVTATWTDRSSAAGVLEPELMATRRTERCSDKSASLYQYTMITICTTETTHAAWLGFVTLTPRCLPLDMIIDAWKAWFWWWQSWHDC